MNNLNKLLKRQVSSVPNSIIFVILIIAILGFVDSTYLTIEHFKGIIPPCSIAGGDCGVVLQSSYAKIMGLPVSLIGSLYYLFVSVGIFAYIESKNTKILKYALMFTVSGLLVSLWFLIVQAFILHAYCLYCLGSALSSTLLFIFACIVFKKYSTSSLQK